MLSLIHRPRRLRQTESIRSLLNETQIRIDKLIFPLFVCSGTGVRTSQPSLPSALRLSVDELVKELESLNSTGIRHILLFEVSDSRDAKASQALNENSPLCQAISEVRNRFPEFTLFTDIALDPYTDHGHDGLFENGEILNDETIEVICEMACLHAEKGAHFVAPSEMMDGRVRALRLSLDSGGFTQTGILAYTAKYASCFYGPFRDTLGSKVVGDKKTYQMDPANAREALRELRLDLEEGADMVMVKPAIHYLDIISDFQRNSSVPVAGYHVSGEAAMLELGAKHGLFDRQRAIIESTECIFRAGADIVLTYFAKDLAQMRSSR